MVSLKPIETADSGHEESVPRITKEWLGSDQSLSAAESSTRTGVQQLRQIWRRVLGLFNLKTANTGEVVIFADKAEQAELETRAKFRLWYVRRRQVDYYQAQLT